MKSFLAGDETAEQVAYKWMLTRTLAKGRRECVDAIWKLMPKTVPEAVAAMRDWEHKYGPPAKVWFKKDGYVEKKVEGGTSTECSMEEGLWTNCN